MPTTPKGVATRRRILDAAWELSDARGAELILGGVTLREVARASDLTPSAVAYHFPTMQELSLAMVEQHLASVPLLTIDVVDQILDTAQEEGVAAVIRLASLGNWQILTTPDEIVYTRRLARCYSATGDSGDGAQIGAAIATTANSWIDDLTLVYQRTADRMGIRVVEPFSVREVARAAAAISEGLLMHWMCEPDAVREELASDVLVALVSAVMAPAARSVTLEEVTTSLPRPSEVTDGSDPLVNLGSAELVASIFDDGVDSVTLTEIGQALGCGAEEVANRFGSVRRLAAMSFHRHLISVTEAFDRRASVGAAVSIADGVYELARCALTDRHCAIALLHERLDSMSRPVDGNHSSDIRSLVPLGEIVSLPISQLVVLADSEAFDLADLMVDTVLGYAATHRRGELAKITELVLRLMPADF